jgi:hypothetical protein
MVKDLYSRRNLLFKLGGTAALILLALFLIGMTGISARGSQNALIQDNWLIVLFKLNIKFGGAQTEWLNILNPLDIVIMALFGVLFLALFAIFNRTSKIWSAIATALPFLGIMVFLITHTAGRSGLMIGGLIYSAFMLRSNIFAKASGYLGIVATVLLFFAGDIGTTVFPPSIIIAALIGIGYVLWMIWFYLIGRKLFRVGYSKS